MGVVAEMADRVLVMYRGDKVEAGPVPSRCSRRRSMPYTRALLAAVPRLGAMQGTDLPRRFELLQVDAAARPRARARRQRRRTPCSDDQPPILRVRDSTTRFDAAAAASSAA